MLPLQLHKFRFRRPDLRNHRKLVVVDGHTGFIGSMNMIKRSYKTKNRYWVDYMVELTGPVVTSLSAVFAVDWYLESEEALAGAVALRRRTHRRLQLPPAHPVWSWLHHGAEPANVQLFGAPR